jgi:uncharacterized delta-60 repeat protein
MQYKLDPKYLQEILRSHIIGSFVCIFFYERVVFASIIKCQTATYYKYSHTHLKDRIPTRKMRLTQKPSDDLPHRWKGLFGGTGVLAEVEIIAIKRSIIMQSATSGLRNFFVITLLLVLVSCGGDNGSVNNSIQAPAGTTDSSFGSGGIAKSSLQTYSLGDAAIVQPDGKIIVLGVCGDGTTFSFTLMRYTPEGVLDHSFGSSGVVYGPFSSESSLVLQNDGKIVVAGDTYNGSDNDIFVVRFMPDGSLDNGFGNNGIVQTSSPNNEWGAKVAIQSDGNIVVAGNEYKNGVFTPFLMRLYSDGSFVTDFGADTSSKIYLNPGATVSALTSSTDDKIIIGLTSFGPDFVGAGFSIQKYTANGLPDTSFGNNGTITDSLPVANQNLIDLKIQGDGKIVAALSFDNVTHGGVIIRNEAINSPLLMLATQATGSIGLIPWSNASSYGAGLIRFNQDGSRDVGFGSGGVAMFTCSNGIFANGFAIQSDGKYTIAGQDFNYVSSFAVMRLKADGSIDNGFGNGGLVTTALGVNGGDARAVTLQRDDKILVTGRSSGQDGSSLVLVRYYQ